MPVIIGVKFRDAGKVYYFDPGEYTVRYHDHVIVETARGIEYGTVVLSPTEIAEEKVTQPLKSVMRMATPEDDAREKENREKEKEAYHICKKKIAEHNLDMKLIEAEYTFDNSKVLFYFTADGRIDFRELVKDLAGIFRTRIELRQIGVRDETKLLGGIGSCGRPLCCHTWLTDFAPVSIKMAKDQNLSLNPTKISGTCGRLMCCLKNEADTYAELNKGLPARGDYVTTPDGLHGDVQSVNILRQTVKVIVDLENDEKELQEFHVSDITFIPKSKKQKFIEEQKAEKAKKDAAEAEAKAAEAEADLEWNPSMDEFDAADYLISDEAEKNGQGQRKQRDRKKRPPKNKENASGKEASSENAAAQEGDDSAKKPRNRRQQNRGEKAQGAEGKPEGGNAAAAERPKRGDRKKSAGEGENPKEEAGGKNRKNEKENRRPPKKNVSPNAQEGAEAAEGAVKHEGGEEGAKPRRRRRHHHKTNHAEGEIPKEMRQKDHYGSNEGE